jgi:hypothetical protein
MPVYEDRYTLTGAELACVVEDIVGDFGWDDEEGRVSLGELSHS